ncbi:hypothetical protein HC251_22440 [Iamia sp. SCSIO 61187]|uniref:NosD domain-containing protein n=1 Tax=Iamia sp. SCSIO 61187 TaxID=2722752 RepID=UPI001C632F09|nr:NosD domain-containing protein [Iamia sp. SCSIO 61187]QYG94918.1 hypothetical protein HC251_22440 [Iamia sp. SCSIO 61187]
MRRSVLAAVVTILTAAAGLTACEPAPTCGAVITADTTLAADIRECAGDGLVIGADGVTLDLGGHTIASGTDDTGGRGTVGIRIEGHDDVTILGGTVTGFATGVGATDAARLALDRLTVSAGVTGVRFDRVRDGHLGRSSVAGAFDSILLLRSARNSVHDTVGVGDADTRSAIRLERSNGNIVTDGTFRGSNGPNIQLVGSHRNRVEGNDAGGSNTAGIELVGSHRNRVLRNLTASESESVTLVDSDDTLVDGNDGGRSTIVVSGSDRTRVTRNLAGAIRIASSTGTIVTYNTVTHAWADVITVDAASADTRLVGNVVTVSGQDGIDVEHVGTYVADNVSDRNGERGIEAVAGVTDGGGNRARDNGETPECLNVVCT